MAGRAGTPGAGALETIVRRLLQAAFRPAGASDEFRDRLIRTSLNILDERKTGHSGKSGNRLEPGVMESFRDNITSVPRVNSLDARNSGEPIDDSAADAEAFRAPEKRRFRG